MVNIQEIMAKDLPVVTEYNEKYDTTDIKMLIMLCEKDDPEAIFELAARYKAGVDGVQKDVNKAVALYRRVLQMQKHTRAMYRLGMCCLDEIGGKPEESVELFFAGSQLGDGSCSEQLAYMYENGYFAEKNSQKALELYRLAVSQGCKHAYLYLGNMHRKNEEYTKAKSYYEAAMEHKIYDAHVELGRMYENGMGVEVNLQKAFNLYQVAYNHKVRHAEYYVGRAHYLGYGTPEDEVKAFPLLCMAVENGVQDANYFLGAFYGWGSSGVVEKDIEKAFEHLDAVPQHMLPSAYCTKAKILHKEKRVEEAIELFKKAAELGDEEAKEILGKMTQQNKSMQEKAAEGDLEAMMTLSNLCFVNSMEGKGESAQLLRDSIEWARKAVATHKDALNAYELLAEKLFIKGHIDMKIGAINEAREHFEEAFSIINFLKQRNYTSGKLIKTEADLRMDAGEMAWKCGEKGKALNILSELNKNDYPFAAVIASFIHESDADIKEDFTILKSILSSPNWRTDKEKAAAYELLGAYYRLGIGTSINMQAAYEHVKIAAGLDSEIMGEFQRYKVGLFGKITYR